MGNELFKKYSIDKKPFLQVGYQSLWSVYNGRHKERNEEVCIFLIDKKSLKKKYSHKTELKALKAVLKSDPLKLHKFTNEKDTFLKIIEPPLEDKNIIGYITEPFTQTLSSWLDKNSPSKLEIKEIVSQLWNSIEFLNKDCFIAHCNLNPMNVFLTRSNKIKISNFSFSQSEGAFQSVKYITKIPITPYLNYIAPEIVLDNKVYYQSDTFSLGCILFAMLKRYINDKKKSFLNNPKTVENYKSEMEKFEHNLARINFTKEDNDILLKMLSKSAADRLTIEKIRAHSWFNDTKLEAWHYIENLVLMNIENINETTKNENIKFLTKWPECLPLFENKIIEEKLLPSLWLVLKKTNLNRDYTDALLPCIFAICEKPMIKIKFESKIWPSIKSLFSLSSLPASCLFFLIKKLSFLSDKISQEEFEATFLHVWWRGLESNVTKIQESIVDRLEYWTKKISKEKFQNEMYPRLIKVLTKCKSNSLKCKILKSMKIISQILDQDVINESWLENLNKLSIMESNSEVLMNIVNWYQDIAKMISIQSIAKKIIPMLVGILVGGNINKIDFEEIMNLVLMYLNRIKEVREEELSDVNRINFNVNGDFGKEITKEEFARKVDCEFFDSFFKKTREMGDYFKDEDKGKTWTESKEGEDSGKINELNNKNNSSNNNDNNNMWKFSYDNNVNNNNNNNNNINNNIAVREKNENEFDLFEFEKDEKKSVNEEDKNTINNITNNYPAKLKNGIELHQPHEKMFANDNEQKKTGGNIRNSEEYEYDIDYGGDRKKKKIDSSIILLTMKRVMIIKMVRITINYDENSNYFY